MGGSCKSCPVYNPFWGGVLGGQRLTHNSDGVGGKPWVDASTYLAPGAFYQRVDDWLPTWGEGNARGMTVKAVKMWQEGACA